MTCQPTRAVFILLPSVKRGTSDFDKAWIRFQPLLVRFMRTRRSSRLTLAPRLDGHPSPLPRLTVSSVSILVSTYSHHASGFMEVDRRQGHRDVTKPETRGRGVHRSTQIGHHAIILDDSHGDVGSIVVDVSRSINFSTRELM